MCAEIIWREAEKNQFILAASSRRCGGKQQGCCIERIDVPEGRWCWFFVGEDGALPRDTSLCRRIWRLL